jgi:hypothetical protein
MFSHVAMFGQGPKFFYVCGMWAKHMYKMLQKKLQVWKTQKK